MEELLEDSATAMARAVAAREVSAVELADTILARVEARNPAINAIVALRADEARAEAAEADRAVASGDALGPLHGVPITVKESVAVAGMPWTGASRAFAGDVADRDATAVTGLRRAGAIPLGVTNTSELCLYYDSFNPLYGATRNPHDLERSAGGSSGGEAAALAAGLVALGVGSDVAGSIRFPAHLTGVFGFKPGGGTVAFRGHHPGWVPPPSFELMAQIGPMARHAEDLRPALEAMSGTRFAAAEATSTVAVFEDDGLNPVSEPCRAAVRAAAEALAGAGVAVEEAVPPNQREAREAFDTLLVADIGGLLAPLVADRRDQLGDRLGGILDGGAAAPVSPDAYLSAQVRRLELEDTVAAWQERYGLALCPVGPVTAFPVEQPISEVDGQPTHSAGVLTLCSYANALRLPACSVPAGRDASGLPVGVQVIGRRGREGDVLELAGRLEDLLGGATAPRLVLH
jgi:Asp-tRNA(Asn)/Glu-tRNA(Gln) amidotransferase A subunit family amidase